MNDFLSAHFFAGPWVHLLTLAVLGEMVLPIAVVADFATGRALRIPVPVTTLPTTSAKNF